MLEKYKEKFPIFYIDVKKIINENKVSHAYLVDVGNISNYLDLIKSMIIDILKYNEKYNIDYEKLIENGSYSDFFVISPDSSRWIKKEQILLLQEKYKTKSAYDNKKIYVIDMADDLNLAASNTLLKFLEEPSDDIVAILITRNKYNIIPTILSRCQLLKLDRIKDKENSLIQENVIKFLKLIKEKREDSLSYIKKLEIDLELRENLVLFVEDIMKCYNDLCRFILKKELLYYNKYEKEICNLSINYSVDLISNKIFKIEEIFHDLEFNVNTRLFLDKLVMVIVGVDIDV